MKRWIIDDVEICDDDDDDDDDIGQHKKPTDLKSSLKSRGEN